MSDLPVLLQVTPPLDFIPLDPEPPCYHGFPILNYATDETAYTVNSQGMVSCVLRPTGCITRVPRHTLVYDDPRDGMLIKATEYSKPLDVPSGPGSIAVITPEAYLRLLAWNNQCHEQERICLDWMAVLGDPYTQGNIIYANCYKGIHFTPQVMANRQLVSQDHYRRWKLRQQKLTTLPVI